MFPAFSRYSHDKIIFTYRNVGAYYTKRIIAWISTLLTSGIQNMLVVHANFLEHSWIVLPFSVISCCLSANILNTENSIIIHKYKIHNDFLMIIHQIEETKHFNSNIDRINEMFLSLLLILPLLSLDAALTCSNYD